MGYWNGTPEGESLVLEDTGIVWGDAPADVMGDAVDQIVRVFREDVGRNPTADEIRGGLEFHLGYYHPEEVV